MWAIGDYNIVTIFAMLFAVAGSYSIGYLFLRVGWPKIRTLGEDYRAGWSIALGIVFSLFVILSTWAMRALNYKLGNSAEQFFTTWTLGFFFVMGIMEIKRKLYYRGMPVEEEPSDAAVVSKTLETSATEKPPVSAEEAPLPYK